MSGSGGTVYDPEPPESPCERLTFKTPLNSPVPTVVKILKVDDELDVETTTVRNQTVTVVNTPDGQTAGSITSDMVPRLLRCIEEGHKYQARVLSIQGARIELQIHVLKA